MSSVPSSSLHRSFPAPAFEENSGARFCGDVEAGEVMPKFEDASPRFSAMDACLRAREIFRPQHFLM